jgi:mannose-1-phosphate guanylyltransferase
MRVLILAAGLGTRLRPLTNKIPKCMVDVGEKPMLQHWLEKLEKLEEKPSEVFVNLCYKKDIVEKFLDNYKSLLPIKILVEKELLGTGGTLLKLIKECHDEDMLVIHCDNYFDDELNVFLKEAKTKLSSLNADGVILAFKTKTPQLCGTLQMDANSKILRFQEKVKNPKSNIANGAVYLFSSTFLMNISKNYISLSDIAKDLLEPNEFNFYAYETSKFFCDIGTNSSLELARSFVEGK